MTKKFTLLALILALALPLFADDAKPADKDKPKQLSAYKLAQMQGSAGNPFGNPPGKKS